VQRIGLRWGFQLNIKTSLEAQWPDFDWPIFRRIFLILLGLGLAYALPLFFDDRYYLDDLGRSIHGYAEWQFDGRPFASIVTALLNFKSPIFGQEHLFDISPLPQIMGLVALALAATILCINLFGRASDFYSALVVFPIIGSPFFLQNLSYKFDAFSMGLAMLCAVVAATHLRDRRYDIALGGLFLFLTFGLYQAAVNVFIGVTALQFLASCWRSEADVFKKLGYNVLKLVIAFVGYQLIIVPLCVPLAGYTHDNSQTLPLSADGLGQLLVHLAFGTATALQFLAQAPLLLLALVLSIIGFSVMFVAREENSISNRGLRLLMVVVCILGSIFAIYGLLSFLQIVVTRPRVFYGFAAFLVFAFYCFGRVTKTYMPAAQALLVLPVLYLYVISYGYAAAARAQTRYDFVMGEQIIRELQNNGFTKDSVLTLDGTQPKSPVLQNSAQLQIIDVLVQPTFVPGQWNWGYLFLEHMGLKFKQAPLPSDEQLKQICQSPPLRQTDYFNIYRNNEVYVLAFAEGACRGRSAT
jgi:Glucosyl transferase GtrII